MIETSCNSTLQPKHVPTLRESLSASNNQSIQTFYDSKGTCQLSIDKHLKHMTILTMVL